MTDRHDYLEWIIIYISSAWQGKGKISKNVTHTHFIIIYISTSSSSPSSLSSSSSSSENKLSEYFAHAGCWRLGMIWGKTLTNKIFIILLQDLLIKAMITINSHDPHQQKASASSSQMLFKIIRQTMKYVWDNFSSPKTFRRFSCKKKKWQIMARGESVG